MFAAGTLVILAYHHIVDVAPPGRSRRFISVKAFASHLRLLEESTAVVTLSEGIARGRGIVLTFDDGYANFHSQAFPLLERFALPATLFVPTVKLGTSQYEPDYGSCITYVTPANLRTMTRTGLISAQSHAHFHRPLGGLPSAVQDAEIAVSKRILGEVVGRTPVHFCYPYGSYDKRIFELLTKHGFHSACTTLTGANIRPFPLFELRRIAAHSEMDTDELERVLHNFGGVVR